MAEKSVDLSFRVRGPADQPASRAARFLKSLPRPDEQVQAAQAIRAFWATHAYAESDDPELTKVALQSLLELTEQILQIALLADLPIDQLNFKSQILSLIQKQRQNSSKSEEAQPETALTLEAENLELQTGSEPEKNSNGTNSKPRQTTKETPKQAQTPGKPRRTLFDD